MTFLPANSITSYVPTDVILPEDPAELRRELNDVLKKIIDALNDKDIGHYNTVTLINGQKFFTAGDPQKFRNVFRKVIDFGALPNTATKSVAHGITWNANTRFIRIYGTATRPNFTSIPLPYSSPTLNDNILLSLNTTHVNITTAANFTSYTTCYVVLEWVETA